MKPVVAPPAAGRPAPSAERPLPAEGAGVVIGAEVAMLLALVAAHDGVSPRAFIARTVVARAEAIGLANLSVLTAEGPRTGRRTTGGPQPRPRPAADQFLQGGEVASRLAHNQEVARSNRAPATSTSPERDHGGSGNPAAPAGAKASDAARAPP